MTILTSLKTNDASSRVDAYLTDQLQNATDLETIDELLTKVQQQQSLLRDQLAAAKTTLAEDEHAVDIQAEHLQRKISVFQSEQADIDQLVAHLTQSNTSDEAVKVFELRIKKLKRLETATGYVEILQEVDELVKLARGGLAKPKEALVEYTKLRNLLCRLQAAQRNAEEAAPHLVDYVEREVHTLYAELRQYLEKELQRSLDIMQWPKKVLSLSESIISDWQDRVTSLLKLQEAEVIKGAVTHASPTSEPRLLLPLEIMARPLSLRFQYHFYGDRPTNRLDKPEYFFSHILDLLDQFSPFVSQFLQPILDDRIRSSEQLETYYTDAISSFVTALLPMVLSKCLSILPQVSKQPQLLSHFIREVMTFDNTLRESWAYTPQPGLFTDWRGLTWEILNTHGYFDTWLEVEKTFALSRYKKIRDAPDSNHIDYDTVDAHKTKPTKGALRVNDLLETVTERYRSLVSFSQKLKFFLDIQLAIFDDYHLYLHEALQAYLVTSHTAGRLIQRSGQSQDDAMGIKGLETLAKIFGNAEYLERKMSDWSEDVFFLELWDELQDRAQRNAGEQNTSIGRDLNLDHVASKTSSTINPATLEPDMDGDNGALFDEVSTSYRALREQAESEIVRALETVTRNAIKPYVRLDIWSSLSQSSTSSSPLSALTPSAALDTLLSTLSTPLSFLSKTLATSPLRRVIRPLCVTIQKEILQQIVMKSKFSSAGSAQIQRDVMAIQDTINGNISMSNEAQRGMRKLGQVLTLLGLPVKTSSKSRESQPQDDEWGFDEGDGDDGDKDDDGNDHQTLAKEVKDASWGLWEAEKAIFTSNEAARKALEAMKLEEISESEARDIIRQRVELQS